MTSSTPEWKVNRVYCVISVSLIIPHCWKWPSKHMINIRTVFFDFLKFDPSHLSWCLKLRSKWYESKFSGFRKWKKDIHTASWIFYYFIPSLPSPPCSLECYYFQTKVKMVSEIDSMVSKVRVELSILHSLIRIILVPLPFPPSPFYSSHYRMF